MIHNPKSKFLQWRFVWPWLLVLAVFGVISWFSAQPGEISDIHTEMAKELLGAQAGWVDPFVRKFAHVGLFFALGAASAFAWLRWGKPFRKVLLYTVVLCGILGGLDEFHQLFVPERAGLLSDVLLDTVGATLGALCVTGLSKTLAKSAKY